MWGCEDIARWFKQSTAWGRYLQSTINGFRKPRCFLHCVLATLSTVIINTSPCITVMHHFQCKWRVRYLWFLNLFIVPVLLNYPASNGICEKQLIFYFSRYIVSYKSTMFSTNKKSRHYFRSFKNWSNHDFIISNKENIIWNRIRFRGEIFYFVQIHICVFEIGCFHHAKSRGFQLSLVTLPLVKLYNSSNLRAFEINRILEGKVSWFKVHR